MKSYKEAKWVIACVMISVLLMSILAACAPTPPVEKPKIKIGAIGPMKDPIGVCNYNGALMAAEEINAAGGVDIGGKNYELNVVKADSNEYASVPDAVSALERLITVDKVDFVVGGARTEAVLAQQEVMADNKIIFLDTQAAAAPLTERIAKDYDRYKYFFRIQWINSTLVVAPLFSILAGVKSVIKDELGIDKPKIAIMFEKAVWADPVCAGAKALAPKLGLEYVGTWRPSAMASDVTAELTAIKAAGAQIIFGGAAGPAAVPIARQPGELKIPAILVGPASSGSTQKSHWQATGGFCNYQAFAGLPFGPVAITEKTMPFYNKYAEKFGDYPDVSGCAYDAVYILKEALERAGTIESDAVVAELEKTDYRGAIGRIAFFPKDHKYPHDIIWGAKYTPLLGLQWQDGEIKVFWPDGKALPSFLTPDYAEWEGLRYPGTVDLKLPPWMIEYWKGKS